MESTPPFANLHFKRSQPVNKDSTMMTCNVIAIALAKNSFQVCHISVNGELLSNKAMSR